MYILIQSELAFSRSSFANIYKYCTFSFNDCNVNAKMRSNGNFQYNKHIRFSGLRYNGVVYSYHGK